jgi:hypothetical protein
MRVLQTRLVIGSDKGKKILLGVSLLARYRWMRSW